MPINKELIKQFSPFDHDSYRKIRCDKNIYMFFSFFQNLLSLVENISSTAKICNLHIWSEKLGYRSRVKQKLQVI
jgi:hypothetical protein